MKNNPLKIFVAGVMTLGLALAATPVAAETRTPVIPNEPVVAQPYGACIDGVWTITEPATVMLPEVTNGRWINPDPTSETTIAPTFTFENVQPGEYTYNFTTAEGNFYIPEQPSPTTSW